VIGAGANVAVGALVHANSVVPDEFFVPPHTVAVGDPLEVFSAGDERVAAAIKAAGFAASAFGVQTR
jgi:carbonic anhydrase/acetyltransferase-like protein (isoleucine patch superfamily)